MRDYAMSIFMEPCHLSFSPIKGPEGNIEYLLHLKKHPEGTGVTDSLKVSVEAVVAEGSWTVGLKKAESGRNYGQVLYYYKQ